MIKTKKITVTKEEEKVEDIICNNCGNSCMDSVDCNYEYVKLEAHWGYGSNKDMQHHTSHICEDCYDKITAAFKIKPDISDYFLG